MDTSSLPANTDAQTTHRNPEIQELLGRPALLEGENAQTYDALYGHLRTAIAPTDFVEEIWARDLAELTWEILRLRRYKAEAHDYASTSGFRVLVQQIKNEKRRKRLIADFISGAPAAKKRINKFIGSDEIAWITIGAHTLAENFDVSERFDRFIAQVEVRRNAILREIDRHRDSVVARRFRRVIDDIPDAEFEDISPVDPLAG